MYGKHIYLANTVCFLILLGFVIVSCSDAHDAFYPHLHVRDVKAAAKRGKILVITLVVSAGLIALITTAILKGDKKKKEADATEKIDLAELRARVIAAAVAGKNGLATSHEQALRMALSAYASACHTEWENEEMEYPPSVTRSIGGDRVTVTILSDGAAVEVRAVCGNLGASATVDAKDGSIQSSIFTAHAMDREAGT